MSSCSKCRCRGTSGTSPSPWSAWRRSRCSIDCDRACPPSDQFTFTLLDERGKTLRRERYNRPEIEERVAFIHPDRNAFNHYGPTTLPSEDPAHTEARRREIECRMERIRAATQPAR